MADVDTGKITPLDQWKLSIAQMERRPRILECGSKTWEGTVNLGSGKGHWQNAEWITTDLEAGDGVQIVGDLETLWETQAGQFDAIYCASVLEHIRRPWKAVASMAEILRPGGVLFISTHQTFPLHGYPLDYFRFSHHALESLCEDAGLKTLASGYSIPATITPGEEVSVWNTIAKAFLNVAICAQR